MSRRCIRFLPHPLIVYLILLVAVILLSWVGGIYGIRSTQGGTGLRSLLDTQGLRWLVSNSVAAMSAAPVGNALLIVSGIGIVSRCGVIGVLSRLFRGDGISYKERSALTASAVLFLLVFFILLWGIIGPNRTLLSLTGSVSYGPLPDGGVFLLFLLFALPAIMYGFIAVRFRDVDDMLEAAAALSGRVASFFLTLLVASQLLAAVQYSGLDKMLGIGEPGWAIVSFVIWWLPLPVIWLRKK